MFRRILLAAIVCGLFSATLQTACAQYPQQPGQAYGQNWGSTAKTQDWNRFYHYPYTYYPHNYWSKEYFKSSNSLYYRYPKEMQIPVYNKQWHNFYPKGRPYHFGHHFNLDVF